MSSTTSTRPAPIGTDGAGRPPGESDDGSTESAGPDRRRVIRRRLAMAAVAVVVLGVAALVLLTRHPSSAGAPMPTSAAMEQSLGIRVTRVAVVGDGGLVQVNYLCLDPTKATEFQSDTSHPPVLTSEDRGTRTATVALMKKGHTMTAGQTYYFVYRNSDAVQPDEFASFAYSGMTLAHIPVL